MDTQGEWALLISIVALLLALAALGLIGYAVKRAADTTGTRRHGIDERLRRETDPPPPTKP